jgi:hypothetical protein
MVNTLPDYIIRRIRAKHKREVKAEVKALYALSPVLWAVVKGYDTEEAILDKLGWSYERLATHLSWAVKQRYLRRWGSRILPIQPNHKQLRKSWAKL